MSERPWTHQQGQSVLSAHDDNSTLTNKKQYYLSAATSKSPQNHQLAPVTVATTAEPTWLQKSGSQWLLISVSKTICCNRGGGWPKITLSHTHRHTQTHTDTHRHTDTQTHTHTHSVWQATFIFTTCMCNNHPVERTGKLNTRECFYMCVWWLQDYSSMIW